MTIRPALRAGDVLQLELRARAGLRFVILPTVYPWQADTAQDLWWQLLLVLSGTSELSIRVPGKGKAAGPVVKEIAPLKAKLSEAPLQFLRSSVCRSCTR